MLLLPLQAKSLPPSQAKIESMARQLGMVYRDEVLVFQEPNDSQAEDITAEGQPVTVEIAEGTSVDDIALLLQKEQVVTDGQVFLSKVRELNLTTKLRAGVYTFAPHTPVEEVVKTLAHE